MANNHTTNYNLNQWEATDKVLRTDFNADNAKIDAALKANADAIDTLETQLVSGLAGKGNCQLELQSYTGDGSSGPTQITFSAVPDIFIIFGYRAIAVGRGGESMAPVAAATSTGSYLNDIDCTWSGSRLSFTANTLNQQMNLSGRSYWVLAFYLREEE